MIKIIQKINKIEYISIIILLTLFLQQTSLISFFTLTCPTYYYSYYCTYYHNSNATKKNINI